MDRATMKYLCLKLGYRPDQDAQQNIERARALEAYVSEASADPAKGKNAKPKSGK